MTDLPRHLAALEPEAIHILREGMAERPAVRRDGPRIVVDDDRAELRGGQRRWAGPAPP